MKILERRGERSVASTREEGAHSDLLPSSMAQVLAVITASEQRRGEDILRFVLLYEPFDLCVSHFGDSRDQITDCMTVGRPSELNLRLDTVAASHRNFTHVHAAE